jgi:urease subunit gamma
LIQEAMLTTVPNGSGSPIYLLARRAPGTCFPGKALKLRKDHMQLTPREFDKLLVHMMADVALKRRAKGLKLNYPEAVAVISAVALDGARAGKTIEDVTKEARAVLTKADVMDGVADLIPMVQIEAVFTDGSRLVTVHTPVQ